MHRPLVIALLVFLAAAVTFIARVTFRVGLHTPPPLVGDESDYEMLALQLARGRGFGHDYSDPTWQATYPEFQTDRPLRFEPTTYRPPLFPVFVAAIYRTVGHNYSAVRIANCLMLAAAGAMMAAVVARRFGPAGGVCFGFLFVILDDRTRYHAGYFMTEPLATLLATGLALLLIRLFHTNRLLDALAAGIVFGLAILARSNLIFWGVVLVPLVTVIAMPTGLRLGRRLLLTGGFVCGLAVVVGPWAVRNSLLLKTFSPLGVHGQTQLAAAYSDEAWNSHGVWYNLDQFEFFAGVGQGLSGVDWELARARHSQSVARAWIAEHPFKTALLFPLRILQELRPRLPWDSLILGLMILGIFLWPAGSTRRVLLGLIVANLFAVGASWSIGGRFLVPVFPIMHAFAACGLLGCLRYAWNQRTPPISRTFGDPSPTKR